MKELRLKFWHNKEKRLIDIDRVCPIKCRKATVYNIPEIWDKLTEEQRLLVRHTDYSFDEGVLIVEIWENGRLKYSEEIGERIN